MWSKEMAAIVAVMAVAASVAVPAFASGSDVKLEAVLADSTGAEFGDAEFTSTADGRMRLKADASDLADLGLAEGDVVYIFAAGELVSTVTLDGGGNVGFSIDLDTDDGIAVPSVMDGDKIKVKHMGTVVVKGTFMPEEIADEEI